MRSFARSRLPRLLRAAASPRIARASLKTALLVGVLLNFVNQGHVLLDPRAFSFVHAALNFIVPFCVASYSAASQETASTDESDRR